MSIASAGTFGCNVRCSHAPVRCLYVEDHASNRALVESILEGAGGVELLLADTGAEGLRLAAAHRPDVILLDLDLPDMSGEEVLRRIRSQGCPVPVVILTADASPARAERLILAGADAYITKPLDVDLFLSVLEDVVAQRQV